MKNLFSSSSLERKPRFWQLLRRPPKGELRNFSLRNRARQVNRRIALAMLFATALTAGDMMTANKAAARIHGGIAVGGSPLGQITTLTLNNSGASSESPIWSKTFGLCFPDSDVTGCPLVGGVATYPQFKSGSNVIAYSMSVQPSYYPSGRLRFAAFALLFNSVVTIGAGANSSISVNQTSNTSKPTPSGLSLSNLTSADLKHVVTVMDGPGSGTTYTSSLNTGVTDNNSDNYTWLDGDAGLMMRIREDYRSAGTPHGALQGYHYFMLMRTAAGGFGGIQYQFCISVPGADIAQASREWYSFSTCQLQTGATVIRNNVTAGRTNSYTVVWAGSGASTDLNTTGSNTVEAFQAFRLTTTGTLPTGVTTGQTYFAYHSPSGQYYQPPYSSVMVLSGLDNTTQYVVMSGAGTGTHTLTTYPWVTCYGRIFACGTSGEWDYIQGGGSVAPLTGTTMTNVQIRYDNTYLRSTLFIPSYDFSAAVTAGSATPFYINGNCGLSTQPDAGGIDEHIGIMPTPYVRYLYTGSLTDERNVRAIGLVGGQIGSNVRLTASNFQIPCANNGHNGAGTTYTGMAAPQPFVRYGGSPGTSNAYVPNSQTAMGNPTGQTTADGSHRTQHFYLACLITGQPEYFDMLIEQSNAYVLGGYVAGGSTNTRISATQYAPYGTTAGDGSNAGSRIVTTSGVTRYCIFSLTVSARQDAWQMAMMGLLLALMPQGGPWAGVFQYFSDVVNDNVAFINAVIAMAPTTYAATNGLFYPQDTYYIEDSWQGSYNLQAWAMVHGLKVANLLTPMNTMIKWYCHIVNTCGIWPMSLEEWQVRWLNGGSMPSDGTAPLIDNDSKLGFYTGAQMSWTSASNMFSINTTGTQWTPSNGDIITFTTPDPPSQTTTPYPAAFNPFIQYFVVNKSGSGTNFTFQLSATLGGSPITLTDNSAHNILFWVKPASTMNSLDANNVTDYPTVNTRSMLMAVSRGATMDATAKAALMAAIPAASNGNFVTTPTYLFKEAA